MKFQIASIILAFLLCIFYKGKVLINIDSSTLWLEFWLANYRAFGLSVHLQGKKKTFWNAWLQRILYECETYSTNIQYVRGTYAVCRNTKMASHCFRACHPITTYIYGYVKIRYGYSTATNMAYFSTIKSKTVRKQTVPAQKLCA
jgi:hypothetical protein